MPRSIFLLPGVGAQGGDPALLGAAFAPGPAAAIVSSSRGIAGDPDPAAAAERLRATLWEISGALSRRRPFSPANAATMPAPPGARRPRPPASRSDEEESATG